MQNKLLGGYAAVRIANEQEFNSVIEWLAIKNCFLVNKEPVSKMKFPGIGAIALYRADDGFIYWSLINDIDTNKYELIDMKQLELTTINDETIVDVDSTVTSETVDSDLNEKAMTLVTNTKPSGSAIDSNINSLVKLIPVIEAKANVVVDETNYKAFVAKGTGVVPELRKWAKAIDSEKIRAKKAYMEPLDEYLLDVKKVVAALNTTADKIASNVKFYEDKKKDELRKVRQGAIDQLKGVLIEKEMISKEYADKFVFDERWLNASCSNKKFQEEAEKQFEDLIEKQKNAEKDLEMIESSIINSCLIAGVDEKLISREKYRLQLAVGENLGVITANITDEVNNAKKREEAIKASAEADLKHQKEMFEKQQKEAEMKYKEEIEQIKKQASAPTDEKLTLYSDEKTGEVYASSDGNEFRVKIQSHNPKFPEDKIFSYTYTFEGNFKAILTFNKCLKALSKVFKTFKYKEIK